MKTPIRHLRRSPLLFPLVYLASLSLVTISAGTMLIFGREDVMQAAVQTAVSDDRAIVLDFIRSSVLPSELATGDVASERQGALDVAIADLANRHGYISVALRSAKGLPIAATGDPSSLGEGVSPFAAAQAGRTNAVLEPAPSGQTLLLETIPIAPANGQPTLVLEVHRDATAILARADDASVRIVVITGCAAIVLVVLLFAIFRAANARLRLQEDSLIESRRRDPLTDLLNHGAGVTILTDAVEATRRDATALGVAIVDVDNFRLLNDVHGSDVGDEVLLSVKTALMPESEPWLALARFGPDEFLVIALEEKARELSAAFERVLADLDRMSVQPAGAERLPISVSVGIAYFPFHASSVAELISAATIALGEAKAAGGKRVVINDSWASEADPAYSTFDVLRGLVTAVDRKDRYTKLHSEDVATYALFIAQQLGLADDMRSTLRVAGLLHDVGKIGVPDDILRKPGGLTSEEMAVMRRHVVEGSLLLEGSPSPVLQVAEIIVDTHHERWDGTGYPNGLKGEDIPLEGRIAAVCDVFDALTHERPYKHAWTVVDACREIERLRGSHFDPAVADALLAVVRRGLKSADPADVGMVPQDQRR